MALQIVNSGLWNRPPTARPQLGAPSNSIQSFLSIAPDSIPPEKVPQIPVSTDEANKARDIYVQSSKALEGVKTWKVEVLNWQADVSALGLRAAQELGSLVEKVRGRTGDSSVEYELELQWWNLWAKAYDLQKNLPSTSDKISAYMDDFLVGIKGTWQDYSKWLLKNAGSLLKDYHDGLRHLSEIKADFAMAENSGQYSQGELFSQGQAISRAEEAIKTVRGTYKTVSAGGDIDAVAVKEYGPYQMGQVEPVTTVVTYTVGTATIVAAITITILLCVAAILILQPMGKGAGKILNAIGDGAKELAAKSPIGLAMTVGFIAAMLALPFALFKSKEVVMIPERSGEKA